MKPGSQRWVRSSSWVGAAIAVLAGVLATIGTADANQTNVAPGKIVGLSFDAGAQTLLKAYPRALYRSSDAGRDWEQVPLPSAVARGRITSVATAAHAQNVLYVAGLGFGVLRGSDAGRSWAAKNAGLPSRDVVALATHADQTDTLYAYVNGRGIFQSQDAGEHWKLMDTGPREKIRQLVHSNMPGSMQTGWLFAATPNGVDRSMDCFCGWRDAGALARPVTFVAYDPRQPKQVYAVTETGLLASNDGGEQWSQTNAPGPGISALLATPSGELYAAVGEGKLFRSTDHGQSWQQVEE